MRGSSLVLAAFSCFLFFGPRSVHALRAVPVEEQEMPASQPAARVAIAPPVHGQRLLEQALAAARPDVRRCIAPLALEGRAVRASARVRIDRESRLSLTVRGLRGSEEQASCVELAVRRHIIPILGTVRGATSSLEERIARASRHPSHATPTSETSPGRSGEDVHAALDALRNSLLECIPSVRHPSGELRLRVRSQPEGRLALTAVDLPPGVGSPSALTCLRLQVESVRVGPSPQSREIVHRIAL